MEENSCSGAINAGEVLSTTVVDAPGVLNTSSVLDFALGDIPCSLEGAGNDAVAVCGARDISGGGIILVATCCPVLQGPLRRRGIFI